MRLNEQIINHEKIHVNKGHSWDLLLAELTVVILWFNPFTWLFRQEVEKNLEYQTDDLLTKNETATKQNYQLQLLEIACPTSPLTVTTNYNQSLIKQRIIKMNAKKSNKYQYWKYAFSIPLLFSLLLLLNRPSTSYAISNASFIENSQDLSFSPSEEGELNEEQLVQDSALQHSEIEHLEGNLEERADVSMGEINIPQSINSDCTEFERAVAVGDLARVKEILKTLDPDCLKIKSNDHTDLKSVKKLAQDFQMDLEESRGSQDKSKVICTTLINAINARDKTEVKRILLDEDLSCFEGENGDPNEDVELIKGLMNYNAPMIINDHGIIEIAGIGFIIDISDIETTSCSDSDYLRLAEAIKNENIENIKNILSTASLTCPFNTDGVTNDFIFIKKIMKYQPNIVFLNPNSIKIKGIGVDINSFLNVSKTRNGSTHFNVSERNKKSERSYHQEVDHSSRRDNYVDDELNNQSWSCADLVDGVRASDFSKVLRIVEQINPDCFHRETTTISNLNGSHTYSQVTTPLIAAARNGNVDFITHLIENDADVNFRVDDDETALMAAIKARSIGAVEVLLRHGAKINLLDANRMTALDYAKQDRNAALIKYLQSRGAKFNKYSINKPIELKNFEERKSSKLKTRAIWKHLC